jgi:hypothetical protein
MMKSLLKGQRARIALALLSLGSSAIIIEAGQRWR